ncbi:phosphotransferase [Reyranella sp.]|uniref:phosphotransferase n=1 Tax=Reyranella sp. TaxID=1929291 RepID=UPI003BA958E8
MAAAFGRTPVSSLAPILLGASAASYRLEVAGRPYLLRLESVRRDEVRDPGRTYACMKLAAEAGLAPPLRHADPAAAAAISDFLPARSLAEYPRGPAGLMPALGVLIRRLQATSHFPDVAADHLTILGRNFERLLATGLFAPGLLDRHRAGFERIRAAWRPDAGGLVSSHNDLNPHNILFDGERLWLIDWETAYRNDPLIDPATVILFLADSRELELALVRACLGREPDRGVLARLAVARLLVRFFYGCASSLNAAHGLPDAVPETDLAAPTRSEFAALLARRGITDGAPEAQRLVGKMGLAGFLAGVEAPEFEETLAVVRG